MNEPTVFELFRQHAVVDTKTYLEVPHYIDVPRKAPKRRKWRLVKKWLKRYGTRKTIDWIETIPIQSADDVPTQHRDKMIVMRWSARSKPIPVYHAPSIQFTANPSKSIPIESTTYQFPPVAYMQAVTWEMLQALRNDKKLKTYLEDRFWHELKPLIEEKTKVTTWTHGTSI